GSYIEFFVKVMAIILISFSVLIFVILSIATIISLIEKEKPAAKRIFIYSLLVPLPYLLTGILSFTYQYEIGLVLLGLTLVLLIILIIPLGRIRRYQQTIPLNRIDERDTMFSRNELKPGSDNFIDFYKRNPDKKAIDENWRNKAGLLKPGSSQYNPFHFAAADASFETIEALKHDVNGQVNPKKVEVDPEAITEFIKKWTKKLGAIDVGITKLQNYHIYTTGGRAERYGKKYTRQHEFAIAFTVEMDKDMVSSAPSGTIVMESGQQYLESGKIAIQLAKFIRNIGYEARAHIDGNYEVVCPLVARDAGLGEIGRMGLLMTPKLGPRVRIAVVTTNLPLNVDLPLHDYSMIDFCIKCKKCADSCPSQAISFDDMKNVDGVKRWQINQEACFSLWCTLGTDCGRCISVCPFSHANNLMHNIVRAGINNSSLFRNVALMLDDAIYGRTPTSAKPPSWLDI
ncbi:MAG: reductive dehalogenase, partial [Bacteroidales bacterium]|nr:reductive dehalogenase [Bacteroidales bacterium]